MMDRHNVYLSNSGVPFVHGSDYPQVEVVAGSFDEGHDFLVRSPLHVLVADAHDEVALLHAACLERGKNRRL